MQNAYTSQDDVSGRSQQCRGEDGRLAKLFQSAIESLKPEATYFFAHEGCRSAWFFFDLKSSADIPSIAEPFFAGMNAKVEFFPVMNLDDLQAGLAKLH